MNKVSMFLLAFLFLVFTVKAQEKNTTKEVESFWKISSFNFTHVLVGYETKVAPQLTFSIEAGGGLDIHFSEKQDNSYAMVSGLKSNFNYYYNYKKRVSKNKNTLHNAANFFTIGSEIRPTVSFVSDEHHGIYKYQIFYTAWGLRRNIARNWNMQFEFGVGLMHEYEGKYSNWGGSPIFNVQFSYNL